MWWLLWVAAGVAALLLIAYLMDRRGRVGNGVTDRDRIEADRIMRGHDARGRTLGPPRRGWITLN